MSLVNDYEFRVFGLRRSGNHAVISWIIGHFPDNSVYYYNDVQEIIEKNFIYGDFNFPIELFRWKNRYISPGKKRSSVIWRRKYFLQIHRDSDMVSGTSIAGKLVAKKQYELDLVMSADKSCLVQTYEDQPLDIVKLVDQQDIGDSKNVFNVLILRDVRNMIASRIEHNNIFTRIDNDVVSLWKKYAYEYLGESDILGERKILINYDRWVDSKLYREKISKKLNMPFSDIGFKAKTKFGGGSSFKESSDYNNRYVGYLNNPEYKRYMNDDELVFLNDSIRRECSVDVDE